MSGGLGRFGPLLGLGGRFRDEKDVSSSEERRFPRRGDRREDFPDEGLSPLVGRDGAEGTPGRSEEASTGEMPSDEEGSTGETPRGGPKELQAGAGTSAGLLQSGIV